jgi:hypothetical protein
VPNCPGAEVSSILLKGLYAVSEKLCIPGSSKRGTVQIGIQLYHFEAIRATVYSIILAQTPDFYREIRLGTQF